MYPKRVRSIVDRLCCRKLFFFFFYSKDWFHCTLYSQRRADSCDRNHVLITATFWLKRPILPYVMCPTFECGHKTERLWLPDSWLHNRLESAQEDRMYQQEKRGSETQRKTEHDAMWCKEKIYLRIISQRRVTFWHKKNQEKAFYFTQLFHF